MSLFLVHPSNGVRVATQFHRRGLVDDVPTQSSVLFYHSPVLVVQQFCRDVERGSSVGRMLDSQSREPGFESPLLPFRSLGIFFHFMMPQLTKLYK